MPQLPSAKLRQRRTYAQKYVGNCPTRPPARPSTVFDIASDPTELCTFEYTWSTAEEGTSSPAHHLCVPPPIWVLFLFSFFFNSACSNLDESHGRKPARGSPNGYAPQLTLHCGLKPPLCQKLEPIATQTLILFITLPATP